MTRGIALLAGMAVLAGCERAAVSPTGLAPVVVQLALVEEKSVAAKDFEPVFANDVKVVEARPLSQTTYVIPQDELAAICERIKRIEKQPVQLSGKIQVRFSEGITWCDGWLPVPGDVTRNPTSAKNYMWLFNDGRAVEGSYREGGQRKHHHRVYYNELHFPILSVDSLVDIRKYAWADFDQAGEIRRTIQLDNTFAVHEVAVFQTERDGTLVWYSFNGAGKLTGRTRYIHNEVRSTDITNGMETVGNFGTHESHTRYLCAYGMKPFYPMLPKNDDPMTRDTYDPDRVRLAVAELQAETPEVEKGCTGSFTIQNVGPGIPYTRSDDPPFWRLRIVSAAGADLFESRGILEGQIQRDQKLTILFTTQQSNLPGAGFKPFLFPEPGKYEIKMQLYAGDGMPCLQEKTVPVEVPAAR